MYYWVNQKKTYKEESKGGYLWAPFLNKNGRHQFFWDSMDKIEVGDVIFNFVNGHIVGYCIAKSKSYISTQPKDFTVNDEWEENGRMVDGDYYKIDTPLNLRDVFHHIKEYLPEKYSPVTPVNGPRANQGYLYPISNEFGNTLVELAKVKVPVLFDNQRDRQDLENDKTPDTTSRTGLVTSRVGQGEYRRRILKRWKNQCAVTSCNIKEILIASHIVPWKDSNDQERLDVENGILLSPVYDALFDRHLISFDDQGKIILSKELSLEDKLKIGITGNEQISTLTAGNKDYLARHREKICVK